MEPKIVNPKNFWDAYFRNEFVALMRQADKYSGFLPVRTPNPASPKGLLDQTEYQPIEIGFDALRAYDYNGDGRFAIAAYDKDDVGKQFESVVRQTYAYRDPAPFGKQRMSELFSEIHSHWLHTHKPAFLEILENIVFAIAENFNETYNQQLAALAWFLGEQRQRTSTKALLAIVQNAHFVKSAKKPINFKPVDTAFSALWKINDKSSLWALLDLMPDANETGVRKMMPLFERLLSTNELLSRHRCGELYEKPDFWRNILAPMKGYAPQDWDRYDANALFWEIRLLSARRLPHSEKAALQKLSSDVVSIVADSAHLKLSIPNS